MPVYDLRHERGEGRCCWCWKALDTRDSHTVVSPVRPPYFDGRPLRFHHRCWPTYQALAGLAESSSEPWTPARVEELRIRGGWNSQTFAKLLHCNPERLRRVLASDTSALTPTLVKGLNHLAAHVRFEQAGRVDWSDPRAFFCLCRHLRWSILEASRNLGSATSTIKNWLDEGVSRTRPLTWARLSRTAEQHGFDASMVVDDRCWTAEWLARAIESSGQPVSAWAAVAGVTEHSIRNWRTGRDAITRTSAWHLTVAAQRFGVTLPPVGRVPNARPPQSTAQREARTRPRRRKRRWTPEMIAALGTAPDSAVAAQLGVGEAAVAKQRARLGVPPFNSNQKHTKEGA